MNKEKLLEIIYSSIDQINNTLASNQAIKKELNEIIIGDKSKLDSTSFLNLMIDIDNNLENLFKKEFDTLSIVTNKIGKIRTISDLLDIIFETTK